MKLPPGRGDLTPVLGLSSSALEHRSLTGRSEDIELVTRDSINIQKDCGEDNICVPDLKISHKWYDYFLRFLVLDLYFFMETKFRLLPL